jgi:3-phenylpropionate/trans-cinnamate dioxygenase alpha subunit
MDRTAAPPLSPEVLDQLVDLGGGEIDRRIFSDPEIFEREMEDIFGRAWLFLCHESQIPKRGDFFEAPMGRDNVLVVRQRDGGIKALVNTCPHRGNAVCRADEGNVRNFMCTYHGWTFDLAGELVGVPGQEDFYRGDLDKSRYPMRKVAQVDSYKGFVFGTFDPEAPPLTEYLGRTGRLSIDTLTSRGELEVVPGVQKFVLQTNWKFPVDNTFDFYHPQITHISAQAVNIIPTASEQDTGGARTDEGKSLGVQRLATDLDALTLLAEYGHAVSGPTLAAVEAASGLTFDWRHTPEAEELLGPVGNRVGGHPHIFPSAWITVGAQLSLRVPRAPGVTEVWWFSFRYKNESPEAQREMLQQQIHIFGPAGFLEQEDGENWSQSQSLTGPGVAGQVPQQLRMGLGRGEIVHEDGLARIESPVNEYGQMWTYHAWKEWLKRPDWAELRKRTTPGDRL